MTTLKDAIDWLDRGMPMELNGTAKYVRVIRHALDRAERAEGLVRALERAKNDFNQIISSTDMNIKMAIAHDACMDINEALAEWRKERRDD